MSSDTTVFSEVLSQKGDLLVHDGSSLNRLPVGANNTILISQSTSTSGFAWSTPSSGQYIKIASSVLTTTASSIEISSIPQTYQTLHIVALIAGSGTTAKTATMYINSNATTAAWSATRCGANNSDAIGTTAPTWMYQLGASAGQPSSTYAYNELTINQYSDTSRHKVIQFASILPNLTTLATSGYNHAFYFGGGQLKTKSAISQVKIVSGSTNFASGSALYVYAYSINETYSIE